MDKYRVVDHYLIQILTGHDCFRSYQYRFRNDELENRPVFDLAIEDSQHVFVQCRLFEKERVELCGLQHQLTTKILVRRELECGTELRRMRDKMLRHEEHEMVLI